MSDTENRYLNRSDLNVQGLLKEKKLAKTINIFACIGILSGISASIVFYVKYKLLLTPILAINSSLIASMVIYINMQFLRDVWQIWTYKLKYWCVIGFILQIMFSILFIVLIGLGIYHKDALNAESHYVMSVWSFMNWKWSFVLFQRTRKYRSMFTRYSLIGVDSEVNSE
ncbi:unnamed protein product [Brachionus calyciflorus]|uniref:Uncharacterized protein n=1 Tax=Brachionus calyciflorus TaxID=104777 RepID=A0A814HG62_9BILA|nr:unnamed protein product [Brachionus calyciflorus]